MSKFEDWAWNAERDLNAIATNLEYVCFVLEKDQQEENQTSATSLPVATSIPDENAPNDSTTH